jgi:molybdopterin synthase catalytic subunit
MTDHPVDAVIKTSVSADPLDVAGAIAEVSDPACGGIAVFIGTVRSSAAVSGHEEDTVEQLDYDAHPDLAVEQIEAVAQEAARRFGIRRITAVHRTGPCDLGEPTVVVATSAPHRGDALDACRFTIDEIKAKVPIWKREVYEGEEDSAWVGTEAPKPKSTT